MNIKHSIKNYLLKHGYYFPLMRLNPRSSIYTAFKHELPLLKTALKNNNISLVFDIGANMGIKTFMYTKIAKKIIAVEPQKNCLPYLTSLKKLYPGKVIIEPVIVSDITGTVEMYVMKEHTLSTINPSFISNVIEQRFRSDILKTEQYPSVTISYLIKKYGIPDYIKIDTEGSEDKVLGTLNVSVPLISFEFSGEMDDVFRNVIDRLVSINPGYRFNYTLFEDYYRFQLKDFVSYHEFMENYFPLLTENKKGGDIYCMLK